MTRNQRRRSVIMSRSNQRIENTLLEKGWREGQECDKHSECDGTCCFPSCWFHKEFEEFVWQSTH